MPLIAVHHGAPIVVIVHALVGRKAPRAARKRAAIKATTSRRFGKRAGGFFATTWAQNAARNGLAPPHRHG
jgi:hypothetical protein